MPGSEMREASEADADAVAIASARPLIHVWSRLSTWPAHDFHVAVHVLTLQELLQMMEARAIEQKVKQLQEAIAKRLKLASKMMRA